MGAASALGYLRLVSTIEWRSAHRTLELSIRDTVVTLRDDGESAAVSGDEALDGALTETVVARFGLMTAAELLGLLRYARLPTEERVTPTEPAPLTHRPRYTRPFGGGGRGAVASMVWLFGRRVIVDVPGQGRVERALADVVACGFDEPTRAALGEALAQQTLDAARQLAPLPCLCGTGCRRPEEHDAFATLIRLQHPTAPIDDYASSGVCRVCGRWWTFRESGDSHYSYHYEQRQLGLPEGALAELGRTAGTAPRGGSPG